MTQPRYEWLPSHRHMHGRSSTARPVASTISRYDSPVAAPTPTEAVTRSKTDGPQTIATARWRLANLADCDLRNWVLTDADLTGANLSGALLDGADLSRANLHRANLTNASCVSTNFTEANLSDTKAGRCDFSRAVLTRADLDRARCHQAIFDDAELSEAKLECVVPSKMRSSLLQRRTVVPAGRASAFDKLFKLSGETERWVHPEGEVREVGVRFSWTSFIWGALWAPLWTLSRGYWIGFVVTSLVSLAALVAISSVGPAIALVTRAVVSGLICGRQQHRWQQRRLQRKGFSLATGPIERETP